MNEEATNDLLNSFKKPKKDGGEGKQEEEQQKEEINREQLGKSKEFINDKISALYWEELQELVAASPLPLLQPSILQWKVAALCHNPSCSFI